MKTCKDCDKRHVGCHDDYIDYKEFKEQREIINKNYKQYNDGWSWDPCLKFKKFNFERSHKCK